MNIMIQAEPPPLRQDSSGALRIGKSQVLLEIVVQAFQDGATPETIVQQYPTTTIADIYAVIAYYLRHPDDIEKYILEREKFAENTLRKIENRQGDLKEIRTRLKAWQE